MSGAPHIAIAGGGFSGSMLALQLAAKARAPLVITLYDMAGAFARGLAHGTRNPAHLLNVRTDRMGALPDRPDDFYRWLLAHKEQWQARHPELGTLEITPEGFVPRLLYGDYLAWLLDTAQKSSSVSIRAVAAEVTDAERSPGGMTLTLADGGSHFAHRLVLAVGNLPAARRRSEELFLHSPRYNASLWSPPENSILRRTHFSEGDAPVLIIGTGLTMVDALLSLRGIGYNGKVIALSRHGLLPQPHMAGLKAYPRFLTPPDAPRTAYALLRAVRGEVTKAGREGRNWREVIDALREDTVSLWSQLPESERRKLRRVLSFWSTHRHRMPPESASFIEREIAEGTLSIRAGHMGAIAEEHGRFAVETSAGRSEKKILRVAHIINCAGPNTDIATAESALLNNLARSGIIRPGPLRMGLAADRQGLVKGTAEGKVFALGPMLAGERLETIAVPELRQQADELATRLLASLRVL